MAGKVLKNYIRADQELEPEGMRGQLKLMCDQEVVISEIHSDKQAIYRHVRSNIAGGEQSTSFATGLNRRSGQA